MSDFVEEQMARRKAIQRLRMAQSNVQRALEELYDHSPGYAGEVEAVKEAIDNAVKVLNGEPVE